VRTQLKRICISYCLILLSATVAFGQFPQSVICRFEDCDGRGRFEW